MLSGPVIMEGIRQTDSRNYGLDILKILSMIYVVILHTVDRGGLIDASSGINRFLILVVFVFAACAVNIFALVTGYVSYSDKPKEINRTRLFGMWFQVVFYGLLITAVCSFLIPDRITSSDYVCSVLPLFSNEYWYFTAYFLVCLFSPLVNNAVSSLSENTLKRAFVVIIVFLSVFAIFSNSAGIVQSFSFPWIFILYFLGAVIRKCRIGENLPAFRLVFCIVLCAAITYIWTMFTWDSEIRFIKSSYTDYMLVKHISPTMLFPAICYLLLFRKIKAGAGVTKILEFLSPCVFAAYLINTHPIVYTIILYDVFVPLANKNILLILLFVFVFSISFVLCSCLIDKLRVLLFRLVRLDKLAKLLGDLTGRISDRIIKKI